MNELDLLYRSVYRTFRGRCSGLGMLHSMKTIVYWEGGGARFWLTASLWGC